jgi:hypothetical protein
LTLIKDGRYIAQTAHFVQFTYAGLAKTRPETLFFSGKDIENLLTGR